MSALGDTVSPNRPGVGASAIRTARADPQGEAMHPTHRRARSMRGLAVVVLAFASLVAFGPAPSASATVTAADQALVKASFQDFLGRQPSASDVTFFVGHLDAGDLSRTAYLRGLATTDEWLGAIVTKMYQDTLGRSPDAAGLATWIGWLRTGQVTVVQAAAGFYSGDEFYLGLGGGTLPTWVTQLYRKLLHREPDAAGLSFWADWASRPGYGRPWVALQFYQSLESRMTRVRGLYQTLLARDPDPTGWPYWAGVVLTAGDIELAVNLAASDEYYARAANRYPPTTPPAFSSVSTGFTHACGVTSAGAAMCWGKNTTGELGNGTVRGYATPVAVVGLGSGVQQVTAGDKHTCALTSAGGVSCWGYNKVGQLGNGTTTTSITPVPVSGLGSGVRSVSAGWDHTCIVTTAGAVKCWGFNAYGELGNGTTTDALTPVDVVGLGSGVLAVSVGTYHSCAITAAGGVKCWGSNLQGELGNGTLVNSATPVDVTGLTSAAASVSAGGNAHTCAVTTSGAAKCWGRNSSGELGNGTGVRSSTPVDVTGLGGGIRSVVTSLAHSCAVTTGGAMVCWGQNYSGQLGLGTTTNALSPVGVSGLGNGVASSSQGGGYYTCAVTSAGARCWGSNFNGQLGTGTTVDSVTPVALVGAP